MKSIAINCLSLVAATTVPVASVCAQAPTAHWPLNGTVEERSGKATGEAHGVSFADGRRQAAVFGGKSYLTGGLGRSRLVGGAELSVAAWVKPQEPFEDGIHHYVLALASGKDFNRVMLRMVAHRFQFVCHSPERGWLYAYPLDGYQPGKWYHLVGVKTAEAVRLYINGVLAHCRPTDRFDVPQMDSFWIGTQSDLKRERFWIGEIDDVKLFDRALSDLEIAKLYHEGDAVWARLSPPCPEWRAGARRRVLAYVRPPQRRWRQSPAHLTLDLASLFPDRWWPTFGGAPGIELYRLNGRRSERVACRVRGEYYEGGTVQVAWWHEGPGAWYALYVDDQPGSQAWGPAVGDGEPLGHGQPGMTGDLSDGLNSCPILVDVDGDGRRDLFTQYHLSHFGRAVFVYRNLASTADGVPVFSRGARVWTFLGLKPRVFFEDKGVLIVGFHGTGRNWSPSEFRFGKLRIEPDAVHFEPTAKFHARDVRFEKGRGGLFRGCADWDSDGVVDFLGDRGYTTKKGYWPDGLSPWKGVEVPNMGFGRGYDKDRKWLGGVRHRQAFWCKNVGTNEQPKLGPGHLFEIEGEVRYLESKQFWPTAADIDRDGDLDVVITSGIDELVWLRNVGGTGSAKLSKPQNLIHGATSLVRSYCGSPLHQCDLDRDGTPDWIVGGNPGVTTWLRRQTDGLYKEMGALRCLDGDLRVDTLAVPFMCDWDGDGCHDLIVGDSSGFVSLFRGRAPLPELRFGPREKLKVGSETIMVQAGYSGSIQGPGEARWGYVAPTVVDWDGDGDLDLLTGDIKGHNRWFENVGGRRNPQLAEPVELLCEGRPLRTVWRTRPAAWPGDGKLPNFVTLDHEGKVTLYRRDTSRGRRVLRPGMRFRYVDGEAIKLDGPSGHCGRIKLNACDWNDDGRLDIIYGICGVQLYYSYANKLVRRAATVLLLRNAGGDPPRFERPRLIRVAGKLLALGGHSVAPHAIDIDRDGALDLIVGDENGKIYYFHRSFLDDPAAALVARAETTE